MHLFGTIASQVMVNNDLPSRALPVAQRAIRYSGGGCATQVSPACKALPLPKTHFIKPVLVRLV